MQEKKKGKEKGAKTEKKSRNGDRKRTIRTLQGWELALSDRETRGLIKG